MRYVTAGESHGPYVTAIVSDVPAGIPVSEEAINADLRRRSMGYGRSERQQIEDDQVVITGGIAHGKTTGAPVSMMIQNACVGNPERNVCPRPGHADLAGAQKYGFYDCSLVSERASARETAARVAAAGVAKEFLAQLDIDIQSFTTSIGGVSLPVKEAPFPEPPYLKTQIEASPVRCPDEKTSSEMMELIDAARKFGDSLGGTFSVVVSGLPSGLGGYASGPERLGTLIGAAVLSIPSVKGVSFGLGFRGSSMTGSSYNDPIVCSDEGFTRSQNNSGGLEGGMTNGMPLVVNGVCKPIPTVKHSAATVNLDTLKPAQAHVVRSDVCVVDAAAVIAEGEIAFVIAQAIMHKFGSDTLSDIKTALQLYRQRLIDLAR